MGGDYAINRQSNQKKMKKYSWIKESAIVIILVNLFYILFEHEFSLIFALISIPIGIIYHFIFELIAKLFRTKITIFKCKRKIGLFEIVCFALGIGLLIFVISIILSIIT